MGLTDKALAVLGALVVAENDLYVRQVAERAGLPPRTAGTVLFDLWRLGLAQRRWDGDGPRRFYLVTDAGRERWAQTQTEPT